MAVKWAGAPTRTTIMTTQLDGLANNTISGASSVVDNSVNLDTYAWLELNVTFGVAPSDANPSVDVYIQKSLDGTNYEDAPLTGGAQQGHMFVGAFPIKKVTTAQRIQIGPIPLPPEKVQFYLDNQTGQSMAASGNTLIIGVQNLTNV